jgi:exodeoxyribonuclease V gamma subunit
VTDNRPNPHLILTHGNHPETMRDLLVSWMKRYPLPPLENEVILVQSNGIAQWLKLALAADPSADGHGGGCGIAAGLEFSLPSRFLWQVYRAVLGRDRVPEVSPFDKSRLIWRLMRLLPELLHQPVYAPLGRFLQNDDDLRKRFQLSERLADLLDQYQVYRADWLQAWEDGRDILTTRRGENPPLRAEDCWQPALWRALLADVAQSLIDPGLEFHKGRAAVHEAFLQRSAEWPDGTIPSGLPRRVMVFGISSLPQQSLEVLAHLGRWIQVLVCVPNPCQHYWGDIIPDQDLLRPRHSRHSVRGGWPEELREETLHQHAQPLLAAWGKQGRDFIRLLSEYDSPDSQAEYRSDFTALGQPVDLFVANARSTLLEQLQDDILDLRPPDEARGKAEPVDPSKDRSLRFHVCHGPQREVEVLQDQLLAAFNADPGLKPRDVIVMVPDIEAYAPHIQSVFGRIGRDDPRYLLFTVADQVQLQIDPLLKGLEQQLNLPQSRLGVSEIMGWLEVPAIRQRFGIDETDIPTLHRWIQGAHIRWGLHAEQRRSLDLPIADDASTPPQNSWLFGLRRMLAGYALGNTAGDWRGIEPYDEIGGLDAALLGPLVLFIERLEATWQTLRQPGTVDDWCQRFNQLLSDFFSTEASRDAFTLTRLRQALQEWQTACAEAALIEPLPLSVAGPYWLSLIEDRGLSQRFFGGDITFATLMPMRAIPFRRVCLLGMNDGAYPRSHPPYDFDLMGRDPRPGDRSRREDDRYLFLEALLSAREHCHISWVGRSITDNSNRPPSVLVGQLRDHIKSVWRPTDSSPGGDTLLYQLTTVHRLQPFNPDYFPAEPSVTDSDGGLFSYAREWQPNPVSSASETTAPLAPLTREEPLTLTELATFLKNPVKLFFRDRLKVVFDQEDPATEDVEPFSLNGLQLWKLQHQLIEAQCEVVEKPDLSVEESEARRIAVLEERLDHIARRGELADGGFGAVMRDTLAEPMAKLFDGYRKALADWPIAIDEEDFSFELMTDEGTVIVAERMGGIRLNAAGERACIVLESSNLLDTKDHYRPSMALKHWVRHLAYHLAGGPITTLILSKKGTPTLHPLDPATAKELLTEQMRAWSTGMTRPLPFAVETATAWLRSPDTAQSTYEGGYNFTGEVQKDACLRRAYPDHAALVASGEFETLARQLIEPLRNAMPVDKAKRGKSASAEGEA